MPGERISTSRPDHWIDPRPYSDASLRRFKHGPVKSMDYGDGWAIAFGTGALTLARRACRCVSALRVSIPYRKRRL